MHASFFFVFQHTDKIWAIYKTNMTINQCVFASIYTICAKIATHVILLGVRVESINACSIDKLLKI